MGSHGVFGYCSGREPCRPQGDTARCGEQAALPLQRRPRCASRLGERRCARALLAIDVPESWVAAAVAVGSAVRAQGWHIVGAGENGNFVERTVLPRRAGPWGARNKHSDVNGQPAVLTQPRPTDGSQLCLAACRRLLSCTCLFCILATANALHAARGHPNHVHVPMSMSMSR